MIYLSADYILNAIEQLAPVHAFVGITFLTCKKLELPVGKSKQFPMDNSTKEFMDKIHRICPDSDYYFQPYETIKDKQWVTNRYPSTGLQKLNTQAFNTALLHEKGTRIWGWANNYLDQIQSLAMPKGNKVPLSSMAIWIMKDCAWGDTATIEDVIEKFILEYHLTNEELSALFIPSDEFPNIPAFQDTPVMWNQLANSLTSPPDASPDQEGTLASLILENVGPTDYMEISFASRLNIITGDNGLGKTFLMDCAWWALTNTWANTEARPKYAEGRKRSAIEFSVVGKSQKSIESKILYDNKNLTWNRDPGNSTIPGLIVYALVDGSYAVWDPSKHFSSAQKMTDFVFTRQQVWNGYESSIEGLIRDWTKWQNTPEKYPFKVFTKALEAMSPPDIGILSPGKPIRVPNDSREMPTIEYPYGTVPIINSSAGVRRIITLAYLMVWAWYEHNEACKIRNVKPNTKIVVMVDELEAHLHPKWQRTILPALMEIQRLLSNELEIQFIISSHSPLVMASIETVFDNNKDSLFQLRLSSEKHDALLEEETFIKYGKVDAWLTSRIFNLGQARSTDAEKAIEEAKALQLQDTPSSEAVNSTHNKLLKCLAQDDTFWPRWIYFAEQHGVKI